MSKKGINDPEGIEEILRNCIRVMHILEESSDYIYHLDFKSVSIYLS